ELPVRRNTLEFGSDPPVEQIHIMTAFCQDHRRGFALLVPVSSHKTMGKMPEPDVFRMADQDGSSDDSAVQQFFDLSVKLRVAEHMAYQYFFIGFQGLFDDFL